MPASLSLARCVDTRGCASWVIADNSATVSSSPSSRASRRTRVASANTFNRDDQPSRSIYIFPSRFNDKCPPMRADGQAAPRAGWGLPDVGATIAILCNRAGLAVDFGFTEEQLMIQDVARRIAQEKNAASAEHHDRTGEFPLENIRTL